MMSSDTEAGEQGGSRVLIVDDDEDLCELLALRLSTHGYDANAVHSADEALPAVLETTPDAVILDLRLGDADGLDVLVSLLARVPRLKVLVLTAHGSIELAVEAMRRGAQGFMTKPFRDDELLEGLAKAIDGFGDAEASVIDAEASVIDAEASTVGQSPRARARPRRAGQAAAATRVDPGSRLVGKSASIRHMRGLIERLAPTDATILITGESGTGKELVARSLHDLSERRRGPFVPLNCGALPPELLTSELFGHTKGAFTGAVRDRAGVFAAAQGGTLFLDEIGEAPLDVQVRLLRVLQEQRYTPVGATKESTTDVRIVAATNRDLEAEVLAKRFREDLYYRLLVVPLHLPPLRERRDDIPALSAMFLERASRRHKRSVPRLSEEALAMLMAHPLPGNVRQLGHLMEAAALLSSGRTIEASMLAGLLAPTAAHARSNGAKSGLGATTQMLPPSVLSTWSSTGDLPPFAEVRREVERRYLVEVLRRAQGNITAAAKMAGRHRTDFYELLRRHNLTGNDFRPR